MDDHKMYVGFRVKVNGEAANSAAGASGVSTGDEEANFNLVIDDVNSHGGVAGRKIVPIYHVVDANTTESNSQLVQEMCADWTQDHHIFISTFGGDPTLLQCLQKAKVATAYDNLSVSSEDIFNQFRYYAEISLFNLNRLASAEVEGLASQSWFKPWDAARGELGGTSTKVGVITFDDPSFRNAVTKSLAPALAQAGHAAASTVYVHSPQTTAELSQVATDVTNAQLKFRRAGIEHVIIFDAGGTLTLLFTNIAQGQAYYPRYGFNTSNAVQALLTGGDVQPQQMKGSMGLGWFPVIDLRPADNPENGAYSNDARRSCTALYRKHSVTFKDANALAVALLTCNSIYFIKASIEAGVKARPGPINRDTFLAGLNALGSSFQSAMTFTTRFGPSKHDGAGAARIFAYSGACTCVRYISGLRTVA